jgi:hypothetical protein
MAATDDDAGRKAAHELTADELESRIRKLDRRRRELDQVVGAADDSPGGGVFE